MEGNSVIDYAPCLPTISATCSELGTGTHSVMFTLFFLGSLSYIEFSSLSKPSNESWSSAICRALWSSNASPWLLPFLSMSAKSELGIFRDLAVSWTGRSDKGKKLRKEGRIEQGERGDTGFKPLVQISASPLLAVENQCSPTYADDLYAQLLNFCGRTVCVFRSSLLSWNAGGGNIPSKGPSPAHSALFCFLSDLLQPDSTTGGYVRMTSLVGQGRCGAASICIRRSDWTDLGGGRLLTKHPVPYSLPSLLSN